jgi:hypothetical protein
MPGGKPYPSGTAYEVLSAIDVSKGRGLPEVYVFRFPSQFPAVIFNIISQNGVIPSPGGRQCDGAISSK